MIFKGRHSIRIADVCSDDPQAQFLRSLLAGEAALLLTGMQSWMWVPLVVRGSLIGGLGVADARKDYFTVHHVDLAQKVANMAALAMTNAELYQHAQALAVMEERQRLARDLHDAINQSLFSAGLIAEVLPRLWERDQQEARHSLEDLRRMMRGAQAEMRALLAELRPATLTDSSLADLLSLLGNAFSGRTNIPIVVTAAEEITLPAVVQIAFYRVCQEALNNIAKHAKANQVEIDLGQEGTIIELRIRDDGQGFDPAQTVSGHYGLSMMRERAAAVGAQWSVASQPGHGAEITLRWNTTLLTEAA
jgi:two-component system nitrate/nitrite sensor histidine kinase NarX